MAEGIFKRGKKWWIQFSYQGVVYRRSSKSPRREDAIKLRQRYISQLSQGTFTGFHEESLYIHEILDDFVEDCAQRALKGMDRITSRTNSLRERLGHLKAADITERHVDLYMKHRLALGRSRTTVNRETQLLGQALKLAQERNLISRVPRIRRFQEHNARQGFFEHEEFARVVAFLPEDLQTFVRFAYWSGWRKGEIAKLEWRDIQGEVIRLRPQISKNHDGRVLPLSRELKEIVARRSAARHELLPFVFHRKGRPVERFNKAWRTACKKAGCPGKLFHDLRRTAARNMVRAGVPEKVAMSISGHRTRSIFDRYNIVNERDIHEGLLRVEEHLKQTPRISWLAQN
jgi:integrase